MKNSLIFVIALICAVMVAIASPASAEAFGNEILVVKALGACTMQVGSGAAEPVASGQMIPYGVSLQTGPDDASLVLKFSAGNGCRVFENTTLVIGDSPRSRKTKLLQISETGAVRVILDKEFHRKNGLKVITPSAVCEAIGCDFTVEYKIVGDLKTTIYSCTEGEIGLHHDLFGVEEFGAGEQVTVATSPEGDFIRIRMVTGDTSATVVDADGSQKRVELTSGDEIQILTEQSVENPNTIVVIYKIDYADGSQSEIIQTQIDKPTGSLETPQLGAPVGGDVAPPDGWTKLTVATPAPLRVSHTPIGKRP